MRRIVVVLCAAMAALLILSACGEDDAAGGGGSDESTATQATGSGSGAASEGEGNVAKQWDQPPAMQLEEGKDYGAVIKTNKGDITVDLFESDAPKTVNNFVFLSNEDFYQNVPFHRIIKGFMVQTGDPTGTGRGGPGYRFADEPVSRQYVRGTLAMANAGPNTNGSQFFIVHADYPLPPNYTIFGIVTDGWDVLDAIADTPVRQGAEQTPSVPTELVQINDVEITTK